MRAHDFAGDTHPPRLGFGLDAKGAAESLRKLAADLESGRVLFGSARVQTLATAEDWTTTLLRLKLYEPKAA